MVVVVVVLLFVGRRGGGVGDDNGVVRLERIMAWFVPNAVRKCDRYQAQAPTVLMGGVDSTVVTKTAM